MRSMSPFYIRAINTFITAIDLTDFPAAHTLSAMAPEMDRRDFLASTPAAMLLAGQHLNSSASRSTASGRERREDRTLRLSGRHACAPSRWKEQSDAAREFYLGLSNDDILHAAIARMPGCRRRDAPSADGAARNSNSVIGQWLSGMSRLYRATGDARMRDKAVTLMTEWAKTVKPDGDAGLRHYAFDKTRVRPRRSAALCRTRAGDSRCSRRSPISPARHSTAPTTLPTRRTTRPTTACRRSGTRSPRISSAPTD